MGSDLTLVSFDPYASNYKPEREGVSRMSGVEHFRVKLTDKCNLLKE